MIKKIFYFLIFIFALNVSYADTFYIDVRSSVEYAESSIPNTLNIVHTNIDQEIKNYNISVDDNIFVFCRSGRRAEIAKLKLQSLGFKHVENIGSYNEAQKFIQKQ